MKIDQSKYNIEKGRNNLSLNEEKKRAKQQLLIKRMPKYNSHVELFMNNSTK
jgi:hypothetical protein